MLRPAAPLAAALQAGLGEPGLRLVLSSYLLQQSAWLALDSDVHKSAAVDQDALMGSVLPSRLLCSLLSLRRLANESMPSAIARSLRAINPSCEEESTGTASKWLKMKIAAAWSSARKYEATQPCKQDARESADTYVRGAEAAMMHPSEG